MSKLNKGGPGCTCSTIKMGSWIMNKDHKTQSTALQRRWEICKMPRKQMQKPKPPSSSVKLEANFPISNVSKALNKTWTLNVENRLLHQHSSWKHYKQHLSAKLLLQTARQEEKSRTSLFFFTLKRENVPCIGDLSPTFKVFDFKWIWEVQTNRLPYCPLQDITTSLAAGLTTLEELLPGTEASLETWTPLARI